MIFVEIWLFHLYYSIRLQCVNILVSWTCFCLLLYNSGICARKSYFFAFLNTKAKKVIWNLICRVFIVIIFLRIQINFSPPCNVFNNDFSPADLPFATELNVHHSVSNLLQNGVDLNADESWMKTCLLKNYM